MKIFVQIASYRDPQLIPTLDSMLENAKRPKNLRIGICRQYHPEDGFDNLEKFSGDKRNEQHTHYIHFFLKKSYLMLLAVMNSLPKDLNSNTLVLADTKLSPRLASA